MKKWSSFGAAHVGWQGLALSLLGASGKVSVGWVRYPSSEMAGDQEARDPE